MSKQDNTYFEDLVIDGCTCPHEDAFQPQENQLFRIVKKEPATSDCFVSHRKKNPTKTYPDECIARAVSTFDSVEGLLNAFIKTPAGKKKERLIGKVVLQENDGMLKQTFSEGHYSWWRSHSFDISSVTIQKVEA
ncbi:hypothetical protein OU798_17255 [Prolixibacteraceae bacterium Z1-6]|uniref:Uncharacterized protein n=1 Tax=Draconibacterium aestuarii TaxID=2998507 RepID=A0A9X3F7Q5_9BACT|nr:hypothetical protein [Prolixibacteraceae bacterium Z1-6]